MLEYIGIIKETLADVLIRRWKRYFSITTYIPGDNCFTPVTLLSTAGDEIPFEVNIVEAVVKYMYGQTDRQTDKHVCLSHFIISEELLIQLCLNSSMLIRILYYSVQHVIYTARVKDLCYWHTCFKEYFCWFINCVNNYLNCRTMLNTGWSKWWLLAQLHRSILCW